MMRSGSSLRGLSEVTIGSSAQLAGHPAHQRPLARVAVAAAAEHHRDLAPRQLAHRAQRRRQGGVGVGVVDEHREPLAAVHRLEPAGDRRLRADRGGHRGVRQRQGLGAGRRGHDVPQVEPAEERGRERQLAARRGEHAADAARVELELERPHLALLQPEGERARELGEQPAAVRIVGVGGAAPARLEHA